MSRRGAILQDYGGFIPEQSHDAEKAAAGYYQRDKELAAQERQNKQTAKAKEGKDATDYITGLKNEQTGVNDIDLENDRQLLAAKERMTDMMQKGASVQDIKIYAMRELPKINNAYTLGKNYKDQVTKGMTDLEKKYGNGVDLNAVQSKAYKKMADDIFDRDDKGNITGYKDPALIPKDKDYIAEIENDSESLGTVFKPSGAFEKGIQGTKLIPVKGGFSKTDKYGKKEKKTYSGSGTIYDEPILNEEGEQTGWQVIGETIPLGKNPDGTVIMERVLPKDQFDIALSSPAAKKDFDIKFNEYLNESGVNPNKLDARAKDVLERKFMYDLFTKTNLHGSSFEVMDEVKAAPAPKISVRVNTGKPEPPVIDVFTTIKQKAEAALDPETHKPVNIGGKMIMGVLQANLLDDNEQAVVLEKARKASAGDANLGIDDIYIKQFPDGLWVFRAEDNVPLTKLTEVGTNVTANKPEGQKSVNKATVIAQNKENKKKPQLQSRKGKDGKTYTSTDGITWKASDGTTVTLQK